jgi:hypothetical protein
MLAVGSPVITEIMRSPPRRTSSASDETERMIAL